MSASEDQSWIAQDERRMLHAVYRVGNMDAYIKYMQDCFGMKLLRYRDIKEEKYTNAFLGYKSELTNFCLEYVVVFSLCFWKKKKRTYRKKTVGDQSIDYSNDNYDAFIRFM